MKCPTPTGLERAFFDDEAVTMAHARQCERCSAELAEIERFRALGPDLPYDALDADRLEEIRTALVSGPAPQRAVRRSRWYAVAVGVAAAAIVGFLALPSTPTRRGHVRGHDGALFTADRAQPDEIIRLSSGTITVDVDPLEGGERFRVVTGDAEIEVRGTTFDVIARDDRLESVVVTSGRVVVRTAGREVVLAAGDRYDATPIRTAEVVEPTPPVEVEVAPPVEPPAPPPKKQRVRVRRPKPAPTPARTDPPPAAPRPGAAEYEAAWAALRNGDFSSAADGFMRVRKTADAGGLVEDATYWHAIALARAGRGSDARDALASFLESHPSSIHADEAAAVLGWMLYDIGESEAARPYFERAANGAAARPKASGRRGLRALEAER